MTLPLARLIAAVVVPLWMAACASPQPAAAPAPLEVTGSVAYRERLALDPQAEIVVQLLDVSRTDAPAVVLAEQRMRADGKQVPFLFALKVDAARIDPRLRYNVSARILMGGQLLFITDTAHPVLTLGQGNTASLMLVRVGAPPR